MVETVRWDDVDGDERPEVVVIIRSPGSGGYVSANALSYQSGSIELFEAIPNVGKTADPIAALPGQVQAREKLRREAQ